MRTTFGRMLAVLLMVGLITGLIAVSGCGGNDRRMNSRSYGVDGYNGMSNSNPNYRMNPTHHNYNKDRQLMRQALREMGLDKQSRIFINGTSVTVTIDVADNLDPREAAAIRSDAYLLLRGNVPRYDYRILFE